MKSDSAFVRTAIFLAICLGVLPPLQAGEPGSDWEFLDNGKIRIGIDRSRGAAIGYLADSKTQRNLLNHFDEGRFIQQSYYGDKDGSMWVKKPWCYNPVQGGSYRGEDATTLEFKGSASRLYSKVEPLHWANAKPCPEAVMQQWITLDGPVAKVRMRLDYSGSTHRREAAQEVPAMFVDYDLSSLVFENDGELIRKVPEDLKAKGVQKVDYDTRWLAYVDDKDFGIGIFTPGTDRAVSYRARGGGKTGPVGSACSYMAPIRMMQLTEGLVLDYTFYLTIGTLDEIRSRFADLEES